MNDRLHGQIVKWKRDESGFTLLEVIVALAIFVVSLGSLYLTFEASVNRANDSAARSEAIAIAQSILSGSLAKGIFEDKSGEVGAYRWEITYEPQTALPESRSRWQLYAINTTVSWQRRSKAESLTFITKRIGPGEG